MRRRFFEQYFGQDWIQLAGSKRNKVTGADGSSMVTVGLAVDVPECRWLATYLRTGPSYGPPIIATRSRQLMPRETSCLTTR